MLIIAVKMWNEMMSCTGSKSPDLNGLLYELYFYMLSLYSGLLATGSRMEEFLIL